MIEKMAADHNISRSRIFVTGLSAGGAMTSAMLATIRRCFAPAPSSQGCRSASRATCAKR